jgi:hypothetical protein
MMKIWILYYRIFRPSVLEKCLMSAYSDFQELIKNVFLTLSGYDQSLSFIELKCLFVNYDWKDILDAVEYLDNNTVKGREKLITEIVLRLECINTLKIVNVWHNSYLIDFILNQNFLINYRNDS